MNTQTPASLESTSPRNWLRIASVALFVIGATLYGVRCVKNGSWSDVPLAKGGRGCDFTAFYSAGENARLGKIIYDFKASSTPRRPFIYPPLFALFPMVPLSLLSHDAAHAVFYGIGMALVLLTCWMLKRWLWPPDQERVSFWRSVDFGLFAGLALCWRFIHANCNDGNANFYILALLVGGLHLMLLSHDTRSQILSGAAVALATVFKLTPGLFGIFFLWSRKWWALLGGAIGLLVFLILIPSLWFGFETNTHYLRAFTAVTVRKATGHGSDPGANTFEGITIGWQREPDVNSPDAAVGLGVSLRAATTSLLTPAAVLRKSYNGGPRTVNIVSLSAEQAKTITNVLTLLVLLACVALTFSKRAHATAMHTALSWSLVAVTMTLVSPMTRPAHLVVLLLPVAALIALLQQGRLSGAAAKLAWVTLLILGLGEVVVSKDVIGERLTDVISNMGFTTGCLVLVFVTLAVALRNVDEIKSTMRTSA